MRITTNSFAIVGTLALDETLSIIDGPTRTDFSVDHYGTVSYVYTEYVVRYARTGDWRRPGTVTDKVSYRTVQTYPSIDDASIVLRTIIELALNRASSAIAATLSERF